MVCYNRALKSTLLFFLINLSLSPADGTVSASRNRLFKRTVTPSNPTGVQVDYQVRWFNPTAGKFGSCFTLLEQQPSTPPTIYSIKYYFPQPDTNVTQYWGPCNLTHYRSGAYHLQPSSTGAQKICFNAYYNLSEDGAGANSTLPEAFALIKGLGYTDSLGSFSKEDVTIHPLDANLPTEPLGEFDRTKHVGKGGDDETKGGANLFSNSVAAPPSNKEDGKSNTTTILIGGCAAGIVVIGIAAYLFVARSKPVKSANSQSGGNNYGIIGTPSGLPAAPVILTEKSEQEENHSSSLEAENEKMPTFIASPKLTNDGTDRQLSLLMHYAAMTDQRGDDDPDSQRNSTQLMGNESQINEYEAKLKELHSAVTREMGGSPAINLQPSASDRPLSCISGNEYFFAEEVLGDEVARSPSTHNCIDHAYLESAIGYHQAQLEQRIQQEERCTDVSVPMSPFLPSSLELDADVFLDHDGEYEAYLENEAFAAQFPTITTTAADQDDEFTTNNNPLSPKQTPQE